MEESGNDSSIRPDPKKKRIKKSLSEYRKWKTELWKKKKGLCDKCWRYVERNEIQLHHIKSRGAGGDDVDENAMLLCWRCHQLIQEKVKR